jgi:exopolyphosphatase/guanosine-5'-triphosphate,3'-diphosphate pyrophosphatase
MQVTRLGQGVDATHKLSADAIDRTVAVLVGYRRIMDRHHVVRGRLVATSAVRDAVNGDEFLSAAHRATGLTPELLAGDEEGRLAHAGATADLPACPGDTLVVDIGGGSTELVVEHDGVIRAVSMDIGCVRLTERHYAHDPPTPGERAAARAHIDEALRDAVAALPVLDHLRPGSRLVGLAGTVSTLAALAQGLTGYQRDRRHHFVLRRSTVDQWCDVLAAEPASARAARAGMDEGRQDVIVGGVEILAAVMERTGLASCVVSESDILDGVAQSLLEGLVPDGR